jgi:hypothetical protein
LLRKQKLLELDCLYAALSSLFLMRRKENHLKNKNNSKEINNPMNIFPHGTPPKSICAT